MVQQRVIFVDVALVALEGVFAVAPALFHEVRRDEVAARCEDAEDVAGYERCEGGGEDYAGLLALVGGHFEVCVEEGWVEVGVEDWRLEFEIQAPGWSVVTWEGRFSGVDACKVPPTAPRIRYDTSRSELTENNENNAKQLEYRSK